MRAWTEIKRGGTLIRHFFRVKCLEGTFDLYQDVTLNAWYMARRLEMLEIGLLWYDNGADDLGGSVARAAARYKERFGVDPNVCYVHPATLPEVNARSMG